MATSPAQDKDPRECLRDLKFSNGNIDDFVTSENPGYTDTFNSSRYALEYIKHGENKVIPEFGWIYLSSFQEGATLTNALQVLRWQTRDDDKEYYRWDGDLPKEVSADSTPELTGGIGKGAWVNVRDASLQEYLLNDDTNYVTPEMFGAVSYSRYAKFGNNNNAATDIAAAVVAGVIIDSTKAIQQAMDSGKPVVFNRVYYTSEPLIQNDTNSAYLIGRGPQETAICKYTDTKGSEYNVDAVLVSGERNIYMRYKGVKGIALVRAKLLDNEGSVQQPKAVENYFNYRDVNLIPQGYGLYLNKADHYTVENVILHGHETCFYASDIWLSQLSNVWAEGATGFVIETGTSVTMTACWTFQPSWTTNDLANNIIKRYYAYDIGGFYHNFESCACDYAGGDGRPCEAIWHFRQGAIVSISSLGVENCHVKYLIDTTAGASGFSTSFINIDSISANDIHNKYGDTSVAEKFRSLFTVKDFCSLILNSGRIRTLYTSDMAKPHIAYIGKKARLNIGNVYFLGDTIKGIQLNNVSYFTSTDYATGSIFPVAKTSSEIWIDSDAFQSSSLSIRNGVLDINVSSSGSDLFWEGGNNVNAGTLMYRYGGFCGRADGGNNVQLRAQNGIRAMSLVVDGTSGGIYDYNVNQYILKQDQGNGGSWLTLGSKLNAQDAAINFQTSGTGISFNSRIVARTVSGENHLYAQANYLAPFADNSTYLGGATVRWISVYAVNGSIQTSDGNKKMDKNMIDSAVLDAWEEVNFYQFKWKDEEILDADGNSCGIRHDPRFHYGVIAQEVVSAFKKYGIDALETGVVIYENEEYGISYSEAIVLEMACIRRKLSKL